MKTTVGSILPRSVNLGSFILRVVRLLRCSGSSSSTERTPNSWFYNSSLLFNQLSETLSTSRPLNWTMDNPSGGPLFELRLRDEIPWIDLSRTSFTERLFRPGSFQIRHECPIQSGCFGRVVKALDLKSNGLCPRRFEPCQLR